MFFELLDEYDNTMAHSTEMEPTSLPLATIECKVCFELVENAVHCVQCKQFLCERHVAEVHDCPFCNAVPFQVKTDHSIRRLVDQLSIECQFCGLRITKGDLSVHVKHCPQRPRNCSVSTCRFHTGIKEEALRHLTEAHGELLWDNYSKLTASVGNDTKTLCANCPRLQEQISIVFNKRDALQQQNIKLQAENARLHQSNLQFKSNLLASNLDTWSVGVMSASNTDALHPLRFSTSKCTDGILLSLHDSRAEHSGDDGTFQLVLCDTPRDTFTVKVIANPQHYNLYIGFALGDAPLDDWENFDKNSWSFSTGRHQLYERGTWGDGITDNIAEGSEIRIDKCSADRLLTFRVNNQVIHEKVLTRLLAEEFSQLVGYVEFGSKGDAVEIISE